MKYSFPALRTAKHKVTQNARKTNGSARVIAANGAITRGGVSEPRLRIPIDRHAPHYTIDSSGSAWMVTVHRDTSALVEIIPAVTHAEAIRLSRRLSDAGLVGFVGPSS